MQIQSILRSCLYFLFQHVPIPIPQVTWPVIESVCLPEEPYFDISVDHPSSLAT